MKMRYEHELYQVHYPRNAECKQETQQILLDLKQKYPTVSFQDQKKLQTMISDQEYTSLIQKNMHAQQITMDIKHCNRAVSSLQNILHKMSYSRLGQDVGRILEGCGDYVDSTAMNVDKGIEAMDTINDQQTEVDQLMQAVNVDQDDAGYSLQSDPEYSVRDVDAMSATIHCHPDSSTTYMEQRGKEQDSARSNANQLLHLERMFDVSGDQTLDAMVSQIQRIHSVVDAPPKQTQSDSRSQQRSATFSATHTNKHINKYYRPVTLPA